MPAETEGVLLERFVARHDAAAFGEIVRRHGPMVYGACMRVLDNRELAAEATQETFYQLVERARHVTESVPAWLHRVATRKAIDLLRSESARARREVTYAADRNGEVRTWRDLSAHVDEALDELDAQKRRLLIEHFFEGRPMAQIGRTMGLSRATISRRIEEAVGALRENLRRRSFVVAPIALGGMLVEGRGEAMPTTLARELGKMAIAGSQAATGGSAAGAAAASLGGTVVAIKTKVIVGAAVAVIAAVGIQTYRYATRPGPAPPTPPPVGAPAPKGSFWKPPKTDEQTHEPTEESASEEPVPPREKTTPPLAQQPPAPPEATEPPPEDATQDQTRPAWTELDVSSPESTARSFVKAMIAGDAKSVLACWSPDSGEYAEIEHAFYGELTEDEQRDFDRMMSGFRALDPDADMPILEMKDTEDGVMLTIQVTFKEDITEEGQTFRAGDTFDLQGIVVRPSADSWLIHSM